LGKLYNINYSQKEINIIFNGLTFYINIK